MSAPISYGDRCGKLFEKYRPCGGVRCSRLTCGNAIDSREGKLEIVVPREIKYHTTQIKLEAGTSALASSAGGGNQGHRYGNRSDSKDTIGYHRSASR